MRHATRPARRLALVLVGFLAACQVDLELPQGAKITCNAAGDCPAGQVCNRNRCVDPSELGAPPDLVGAVLVDPAGGGKAGASFTVSLESTKALEAPPRVILGLAPPLDLPCTSAGGNRYTCPYAATGFENGGKGGLVPIDVRMVDLAGNETVRNGVATLVLDFAAPVLAARSAEPASAALGSVLQVFLATDEALGGTPVLVASRALDEPGDGTHLTPTAQAGTNNWLFTHLVTAADGSGPVHFTVDLVDAVGNATTAVPVGSVVLDSEPPAISALAVSPARLGASGTLTVTFDASEAGAPGTPAVTVGGREMSCGAYAAGSPSYTCTRAMAGDEIGSGTEAVQSVVVSLADAAGNRATASGSAVFDLKVPGLAGKSADPANVPLGGVVLVSLTPDEELGANPVLVASRALGEPGATRFTLTRQPGTRNYQFTHLVTAADGAGPVDFTVELADLVGNSTTGVVVGSVVVDNVVPAVSALSVSPGRIGRTGTLTATFDASEPAAPGALAVSVGGRPMSCGPYAATSPRYTCTRAMAGDEIAGGTESSQTVVVGLADAAGNRTTASGSAVFDFKAPALAAKAADPPSVPLGGEILVSFTPDEDLGPNPVLVASRALEAPGGTRFTLSKQPGTRNYQFAHVVTAGDGAGPVDFTVELADPVGNGATGLAVGTIVLDPLPPAITSLQVSPARLGASGTLTVAFDASEPAAPDTLAVTVGGRPMTCGPYQATPPRYTCTRAMAGDEIAAGTEAVQSVVVSLADAAGNRATASGSAVFDLKAPALAAKAADPADVPLGGVILVSFTPDEELGPNPVLVASRVLDGSGATRFPLTKQPGTRNYQFTHLVTAVDGAGPVDFTVELTDLVGNAVAGLAVGSVVVDNVVPAVTSLAVTPARIGRSGTLTATFDASEPAAPGALAVTVGGRAMTCGPYQATSPRYTCTRAMAGDEIAQGTEATQSVVVNLADAADNRTSASGGAVFDFKAPGLAGKSADPANVPLGGTVLVSITPDEDLGPNPVLVASRALDEPGGTRFTLTRQPGTRNYPFAHVVTAADAAGPVTFTVELADLVGNAVTGLSVGSVVVDNVVPAVTSLAVSPARIGRSGTLTATFDASEPAAPGGLTVSVGGRPMTCGPYAATSPRYTCTRLMAGDEIATGTEATQPVVVSLADVAGNRASASGSAVFDFRAPALAGKSAEPANVPLGGLVLVSFTPDEDLGPNPVLVASRALDEPGGTRFALVPQAGTRNYQFAHVVTAADASGPVTFTVELTDAVGNAVTGLSVGSVVVDNVVPVISSLSVSPARIGRSGTLTATFDASEPAAPGALSVAVGGRPMTCGPYAATPPRYTCTRLMAGDEIATGTEATQPVVVSLADVAGNRASASGSAVFDFRAPALAGRSAEPANVPLGGVILVSLTPDEDLGPNPVLVASRALDEPGGTRFTLTRQAGTRNYQFTHLVTTSDTSGPVDFTVELADAVGNAVAGVSVGSVVVDVLPPTISSLAVSPARIGRSGTLTATFDTTEAAAPGTLSVSVGGRPMGCGPYAGTSPRYTCTRAMAGNEIAVGTEAAQSVVVGLADVAGNRTSSSGSALFDFRPPALAGKSADPANVPLGGVIVVSFTPDEDLGPNPVLVASRALDEPGATRFTPTRQAGTRNYQFTHLVTAADTSGPVDFTVELADAVGNAAAGVAVGSVAVDNVVPVISALSVSPARIGRSGTLTATFDASEPAAPGGLTVSAGGRPMTCGPYAATSPRYTCTRAMAGDEIATGTEATQPVVVGLADLAGNRASTGGSTLFDFRAPALAGKSADPANVPLGGVVLVSFTPDEELGPNPVLVASRALDEPGGTRFTLSKQPGTRTYQFAHVVTAGDGAGPVDFTVELADPVGNAVAGVAVGTLVLDPVPPAIASLQVSPARLGASGTLTVTFDASEPAAPGTLVVTVGGLAMTCGPYQATSPRYTCTRAMAGDEIPQGTEATQSVVVGLADLAGNRASASGSTLFDLRAPALAGKGADPANVPLGGVILVSFTPDEDLGSNPVLVASRALDEPGGGTRFTPAKQPGTRNYQFTHLVTTSDTSGPVAFTVELTDAVGNAVAGLAVGSVVVDTVFPAITALSVSPARIGRSGTLTVTFDTTEAAAPGTLSVTAGGRAMTCGPHQAASPSYTCTRAMVGDEIAQGAEAAQSVVVTLADVAGNRTTSSGSTVFDFRPPAVAAASIAYTAPAGSVLPVVARATAGARVTVTAIATEALDLAATPGLTAAMGANVLAFTYLPASSTSTSAVFETVVPAGTPDGDYTPTLAWRDLAGNGSASSAGLPAVRVKTSTPRLAVDQRSVVFVRSPWGNASPEPLGGYTIPAGAYFALEPADPLSPATTLPAGTFLLEGGVAPERVLVRLGAGAGALVAGTLLPGPGGTWPRQPLAIADAPTVHVAGVDDAGNTSDPVMIGTVEWVATSNLPLTGASPHAVLHTPVASRAREQRTDVEPAVELDVAGGDGRAALAVAQEAWTRTYAEAAPPISGAVALAYDSARGRVVMFGGRQYAQLVQDTWEWDGARWLDVTPGGTKPPARESHALVYDSARGRVVLFGGWGKGGTWLQDTWEWDGTSWEDVSPSGATPPARYDAAMAYDSGRGRAVLFGGFGYDAPLQDTWEWDGTSWTAAAPAGPLPDARYAHGLACDASRGRVVLFGGRRQDGTSIQGTWEWNGTSWIPVTPAGSAPVPSAWVSMAYHVDRRRVLLHGGWTGTAYDQRLWEWDGSAWTDVTPPGAVPSASSAHAMAYDAARGQAVLYVGEAGSGPETWAWDGASWRNVTPSAAVPPADWSYNGAMAYDAARGVSVLFAGRAGVQETWEWNGGAWRNVTPAGISPSRYTSGLAYDAARMRTTLVTSSETWEWDGASWTTVTPAGAYQPVGPFAFDSVRGRLILVESPDTWALSGGTWILVTPPGPTPPGGLMTFDGTRGRLVLYEDNPFTGGTTWEWNRTAWWDATPVGTSPTPRGDSAIAFDPVRGRTVLFGGNVTSGGVLADTWEWDGTTWRDATPPGTKPGPRRFHSLAFDSARGRMVLYGGLDPSDRSLADTWELDASPASRPAIQLDASMTRTGIDVRTVARIQVRAYAGGTYAPGGPASVGATLRGWTNHAAAGGPGAWTELAANGAGVAAAQPYLGPPATTAMDWRSASAPEARRLIGERDGRLSFQVVPSGTMGPDPGVARVALDYIEVRVRYSAQ